MGRVRFLKFDGGVRSSVQERTKVCRGDVIRCLQIPSNSCRHWGFNFRCTFWDQQRSTKYSRN